ncbi:bifunctional 2-polyprenyl-6-hydroxyphenol methylase/3-demethylubiquinol 3-O-methyltransferase UbiG [Nocardioides sp. zg-DK7169]|uniref:class I SAM-dependent methyltransferase n=1 Tax=Nocardioides sp. zg-DK7169 TaxID=2736600 RepID=UPI001551F5FA|nr:class I SAM-dependent methyltransferase [Nocardioides sp. zg-DK7169]NPC98169.1 class I SAM-dependent methyltransferase [Nocardioides sp. zg-DK7169]
MTTRWERIARANNGEDYAAAYAERFRALAAQGQDIHGEAVFVQRLLDPPAQVLDAGCGTGRITERLAELGYAVVGTDVDATMLEQARAVAPALDWRLADLATMDLGERFDLVLLAGNIIPLLEPGTLGAVAERLAAHAVSGGLVVCGFGLDSAHLPAGCAPTPLAEHDAALAVAGLEPVTRYSTWDGEAYDDGGYVITVHRRPEEDVS